MLADLGLLLILLLAALLGLKLGFFDMLGRLLMLLLSLGLTMLLLGPVTGFLSRVPWLEPLGSWLTNPLIQTLENAALTVEEAVDRFALPPLLEALMNAQAENGSAAAGSELSGLTVALFRFALMAAVFVILFAIISFIVHKLTRLLTRWSDALPLIGTINRLGGLVAGAVFGQVVINILLLFSGFLAPYFPALVREIEQSSLARPLYLFNFLADLIRTT